MIRLEDHQIIVLNESLSESYNKCPCIKTWQYYDEGGRRKTTYKLITSKLSIISNDLSPNLIDLKPCYLMWCYFNTFLKPLNVSTYHKKLL